MLIYFDLDELKELFNIIEHFEYEFSWDGSPYTDSEFYKLKNKIKKEIEYYDTSTQEN